MLPGSSFSCVLDIRDNRSLQSLRDIMPSRLMMLENPVATSVVLFICDFLAALLRDSQPDAALYDFVDRAISHITSTSRSIANSPIAFLISLMQFMASHPTPHRGVRAIASTSPPDFSALPRRSMLSGSTRHRPLCSSPSPE